MKTIGFLLLGLSLAVGFVHAAEPLMLQKGSWICRSPEAYEQAIERQREAPDLTVLRQQLRDEKLCMHVAEEHIEDMMAPFVQVLSRQGEKVKVSFTVEFYKRIASLHRRITRVTFAGWTDAGNLEDY